MQIIYKVTSTYPPALTKHPAGGQQIVAGTIYKVEVGSTLIPITQSLPESTSVSQLVWVQPERQKVNASTKIVKGSKGITYTVTTLPTGRQTCTCPGFTFRRTCKHIGV